MWVCWLVVASVCGPIVGLAVGWAAPPVPDGGTRAEVRGSVVNVIPNGSKSILIVNRGALYGVVVGDVVMHPEGPCRVTEVYDHRLKCVLEVPFDVIGAQTAVVLYPFGPRRGPITVRAKVIEVAPDAEGASLRLDHGFMHGLRPGFLMSRGGNTCQIWQVMDREAWCFAARGLKVGDVVEVSTSEATERSLPPPGRLTASEPRLRPQLIPPAGVRSEAPAMSIARGRGHGLLASHVCLGFTPDALATYVVLMGEASGLPPFREESGLVVKRVDLATGGMTTVLELGPMQVAEARQKVEALRTSERLLGCHWGLPETRNPDGSVVWEGTSGQSLDYGAGRRAFVWFSAASGELWAIESHGRRPAVSVAKLEPSGDSSESENGVLLAVYFIPGSATHLALVGARWIRFDFPPG